MAEGGKRVDGVWKENRARMPFLGVAEVDSVAIWPLGCECRREKKVRSVGKPTMPKKTRTKRWGGILMCGVPTQKLDKGSQCGQGKMIEISIHRCLRIQVKQSVLHRKDFYDRGKES